ncbi:protein phosphatase [Fistulifera solaris]|jgi:ubiquitin-like domain-containing CTD phosphatase 1|uniref:Protein phosphatase n=1 Tax=Fistulifera solaris TaxID=1519565 RepID=A0A1Z5KH34_FISSO|nr:protein phosphatase [Fistulifera solaris]|eukprot:GAX25425.1 protein phosphatase [Fistulifera solaris]
MSDEQSCQRPLQKCIKTTEESVPEKMDEKTSMTTTDASTFTLIAKFGKERIQLNDLSPHTTIEEVKLILQERTRVLCKRQKLVGLVANEGGAKGVHDALPIMHLKSNAKLKLTSANRTTHQFILMGTPEESIFVDPDQLDELPDVIEDFDLDFNAGSEEWLRHVANGENLKKFTADTLIHMMNPPRDGKPLLVLDLDHTLLDFSSRSLQRDAVSVQVGQGAAKTMKRPHMDEFLTHMYHYYDLVVWSQTSWRWLETKLTELGMIGTAYKFCFVLDKTSMFTVTTTDKHNQTRTHHVKPLQIIWSKFSRWSAANTVHLDDLSRNFALNMSSGLKCTPFYRKKNPRDAELLAIGKYLVELAQAGIRFDQIDFGKWKDVALGECSLLDTLTQEDGSNGQSGQ